MQQRDNLDFLNTNKVVNLPQATAAGEAVVFEQMQALLEANAWKDNARVATQANVTIAGPGATIDGITMVVGDRVLVRAQTAQTENGIYVWNGAAVAMTRALDASTFDELESGMITVDEGTDAGKAFRQSAVNGVIGTNNVVWVSFGTGAVQATETLAGIAELATQAETDIGTDDQRIVTPLKLKTSSFASRGFTVLFGDGSATQYNIDHNLNGNVVVQIMIEATGEYVNCRITKNSVNRSVVNVAPAPASDTLRALVHKVGA
jgi:hypothetical protein